MRIPLTKYGLPQVALFPLVVVVIMAGAAGTAMVSVPVWIICMVEAILLIFLGWVLSFFRDPERIIPDEKNILLAPADGKITDIEAVEENEFIKGQALRIGIFLSVFDVHINRAPCDVRVEAINYRQGKFKDARDSSAGKVNESNDLYLMRKSEPNDKLIVRQISGAIARRIVCDTDKGGELACGEKFGMIKFGSRTELYVEARPEVECAVKVGDKVKAGESVLVRYVKQGLK
jgi:phosphatidylserine decarboxylase